MSHARRGKQARKDGDRVTEGGATPGQGRDGWVATPNSNDVKWHRLHHISHGDSHGLRIRSSWSDYSLENYIQSVGSSPSFRPHTSGVRRVLEPC